MAGSVPGWAYAVVVIGILLVITVIALGVVLHRTRMKLRNGNDSPNRFHSSSSEEGDIEHRVPQVRQSSVPSALSSISRVFAKNAIEKDDDMEARSPMMADIGQSWSSPPRPPRKSHAKQTPNPYYPYHTRSGSLSSITNSEGGEGATASVTSLQPAPRRVRGPRKQPTLNTTSETTLAGVPSAHASTSTIRSTIRSDSAESSTGNLSVSTHESHRSAVTPASMVAPHPPHLQHSARPRRPSVSVNTSLDGHGNTGEWQRMPFIPENKQVQSTDKVQPRPTTACSSRDKKLPSIVDMSPGQTSPDSMYSTRTSVARSSTNSAFKLPSDAPPVPPLPGYSSKPTPYEPRSNDAELTPRAESARATVITTSEPPARKGRNTFGSMSALTATSNFSVPSPERTSSVASRSNPNLSHNRSESANSLSASTDPRHLGHRRAISQEESYAMPGIETTEEYDEQALLTPKTARSAKFLNSSIDRVLATADQKDQKDQVWPPPQRFSGPSSSTTHSRRASAASLQSAGTTGTTWTDGSGASSETSNRHGRNVSEGGAGSIRGTSECSASTRSSSGVGTFSFPHTHTRHQQEQDIAYASLLSGCGWPPNEIDLNTPRTSIYEKDMSNNPYMNPTVCLQPPSRQGSVPSLLGSSEQELDLTVEESSVALASVTARTRRQHDSWGPPLGGLRAFIPGFPSPPYRAPLPLVASPGTPPTPGMPATPGLDEGSWSSWGTNPDMERALFQRILAMKNSDLAPLNMAALTSLSSIQSAVPSTPGGPDVSYPDGYALAHTASSQSLSSMTAAQGMHLRGMPAAAAAFLARLRMESEELSTPSTVQPPDWDVRMWTRANVDGTL